MAGSEIEQQAAYITAPHMGSVSVTAISAVSARVNLAAAAELGTKVEAGRYICIVSDGADIYYFFNNADAGTADRTATGAGTVANRTFYAPAGVEKSHVLRAGYTWLVVQGSGAGYVRAYISSVPPHENQS